MDSPDRVYAAATAGRTISLRRRYLIASLTLIGLLLTTLVVAYVYVNRAMDQNAATLALTTRVSVALDQIPSKVREADHALQDLLARPERHAESTLVRHVTEAGQQAHSLLQEHALADQPWRPRLAHLADRLQALEENLETLLQQYSKPGWLYPAIPLIAGTMFDANTGLDSGLQTAIDETAQQLDQPGQLELYRKLVDLRDLWRRLILDFRSHMIQFAGLPGEPLPPVSGMNDLARLIMGRITDLERNPSRLNYGFETEELVPQFKTWATHWFQDYQVVRAMQASGHWRSDVRFVAQYVRPLQQEISRDLFDLERAVAAWNEQTSHSVRSAASDVNHILWAMAGLALTSALLNYLILDRGLIRPVSQVSDALAAEASGAPQVTLPSSRHQEVVQLVEAFERMRAQIQIRQQALEHQALHDVLTDLPNRALLNDRLRQGIRGLGRQHQELGLLLMDLDRFKDINDTLGHQVGDQVLTEVATRLLRLVRESDTVARLGGDEFAVVLPGLNREAATELAQRIARTLDMPYTIDGEPLYLGASIGIVMAPEDGEDPATLLRRADSAMYRAKQASRDYAFYTPDQDRANSEGIRLTARLRETLARNDDMILHYQPKLSLGPNRVEGMEALLRWSADGAPVRPDRAVQLAERANLIKDLTRRVLEQALRDCAAWQRAGHPVGVAVNLSARNIDDSSLPAIVQAALHQHRLPPSLLTLEITESAVMAEPKRAKQVLGELAEMGVRLSIDDFGTGFSSLAYLSQLSVHELKIDKTFVQGMARGSHDALIVEAIIQLAHDLGLLVVAEGIEDQKVLEKLRASQCDQAQGYFISRPLAADALSAYFDQLDTRHRQPH